MPELRPLVLADAPAVCELQVTTFQDLERRMGAPVSDAPTDPEPARHRVRHLATTDPAGAWVAVGAGGQLAGAALALRREGLWGLSLLVVRPDLQSAGIGSALLRRTLEYADGARGAIILASSDPRALRAYAQAGFELRPTVDAHGPVRRAPAMPRAVRPGHWPEDCDAVDAAGRAVRGASHANDLPVYLRAGAELLVHEDGGFAVHAEGELRVLAATADGAARELLQAVLHRVPAGRPAAVDFLDARQDWAFECVVGAGLELRTAGATFVRGDVGPLRPYLPSGAFL